MKKVSVTFGILLVLCAVALILDAVGIGFAIAPWKILLATVIIGVIIWSLMGLHVSLIFFPLSALLMIFETDIARLAGLKPDFVSNWLVLGVTALLWLAFLLLFEKKLKAVRKRRRTEKNRERLKKTIKTAHKINVQFEDKTNEQKEAPKSEEAQSGGADDKSEAEEVHGGNESCFECRLSSKTFFIDATDFMSACVHNELGDCTVTFRNADKYKGGGTLNIYNRLGNLAIKIPAGWTVVNAIDTHLAAMDGESFSEGGPTLTLVGTNELGNIDIES